MAEKKKENNTENLVLVINCSKCLSSEEFIKQIVQDKFSSLKSSDGFSYHSWRIENKYYCADVKFLIINGQDEKPNCLKNEISAVVILFDQIQSSFEMVKEWISYIKAQDPSVVLLVGSKSPKPVTDDKKIQDSSSMTRHIQEFSIEHSFEFIDLNEEIDPEDDFPDTVGFARIVQALQATEWSSLHIRGQATVASERDASCNRKLDIKCGNKTAEVVSGNEFETLHMFDGVVDEADLDGEPSFDKLFSQMKLMKEKAESLPHAERKAYAEQVAIAFWKAIGGDEAEIEDLNEK